MKSLRFLQRNGGLALLCLLPLMGCESETAAPGLGGAARIELSTDKMELFEGDTVSLEAVVVDINGNPIEGGIVELTSSDTAVAQAAESSVFALNPGSTSVKARYGGLLALLDLLVRPSATGLEIVDGNDQKASAGSELPKELKVRVVDRRGSGVSGTTVEFVVKSGRGQLSVARVMTTSRGEAATRWTLGPSAGEQIVEARAVVGGSVRYSLTPVTFRATATSGTPPPTPTPVASRLEISPASVVLESVGSTAALSATIYDQDGQRMSGQTVSWSSLASGVATVNGSGTVRAVSVGSADIVARASGVADTVTVRVAAPPAVPVLRIAPSVDTLTSLGASRRLTVSARDANGSAVAVSGLNWKSLSQGVAEVDRNGNVVARGLGTALIVAAASGFAPDTATIVVRQDVATIALTGARPSLEVGQSMQLSVTARDANGNDISGAPVSWSSSRGAVATVSTSGLVRAMGAGSATITASSGGRSASATVAVNAVTPPPGPGPVEPPPSGNTVWTNEPAGFSIIEDYDWSNGFGKWTPLWNENGRMSIVPASGAPFSGNVVQQIHPRGLVGGGSGTSEANFEIPVNQRGNELYVGVWVRVNPEWTGHSSGINKFFWVAPEDGGVRPLWLEMYGQGSNPLRLYVVDQMTGGCGDGVDPNVNTSNFIRGKWHKVEMYLKFGKNSGDPATIKVWVDGVLNIDRNNLCTPPTPQKAIARARLTGIWGGIGDAKPQQDFLQWGPVRISGR